VGSVGKPVRQEAALAAVTVRLDANPDVCGALVVGSLASHVAVLRRPPGPALGCTLGCTVVLIGWAASGDPTEAMSKRRAQLVQCVPK